MSLSPVTTASAQRSINRSISVEISTSPAPRFLLMYWETAARVTPSFLAASLWLRPCFCTSRDHHLRPHGWKEVPDHGIAVHQGTGMLSHAKACCGLADWAVLNW